MHYTDMVLVSVNDIKYVTRSKVVDRYRQVSAVPLNYKDSIRIGDIGAERQFVISSAISYALEMNNDPIAEYNQCVTKGFPAHWICNFGPFVTGQYDLDETGSLTVVVLAEDDIVLFEGRLFTVEVTPEKLLKLMPYN